MTVKAVAICKGCRISDVTKFSYELQESSGEEEEKKVKLTLNVTPQNVVNKAVKWKRSNKKAKVKIKIK